MGHGDEGDAREQLNDPKTKQYLLVCSSGVRRHECDMRKLVTMQKQKARTSLGQGWNSA